jgi:WhiB family redox-sensing transcriptional regulator
MPASLFYPERGSTERIWVAAAKAVCSACPVRRDCLAAGMSEPRGVWGGLTAYERRRQRHQQKPQVTA